MAASRQGMEQLVRADQKDCDSVSIHSHKREQNPIRESFNPWRSTGKLAARIGRRQCPSSHGEFSLHGLITPLIIVI